MAYNEKSKVRTMRYMKENRDKLTLNLPKGAKEKYKEYLKSKEQIIIFKFLILFLFLLIY